MAAPTLNDYEYQFKDAGVLLGGSSETLPFWDIETVEGIDELAPMDATISDMDGTHGSFVSAKYVSGKTIIISGTLFADPLLFSATAESVRDTMVPDGSAYPLYFKHPGLNQRYISCKPLGFKVDLTRGRNLGMGAFQMQLAAGDPRQYEDNAPNTMSSGVAESVDNNGNTESFPIVTLVGALDTLTLNIGGTSIVFSSIGATSGQTTILDTGLRQLTVAGVDKTAKYNSGSWAALPKGSTNVTVTTVGGTPSITLTSKSAWL